MKYFPVEIYKKENIKINSLYFKIFPSDYLNMDHLDDKCGGVNRLSKYLYSFKYYFIHVYKNNFEIIVRPH